LHFGGLVLAFDFIGYLNYRLDNLLVGWFLGPTSLGYYDKAYQFLLIPINQIAVPVSGVAQSALSTAQNDLSLYRASLRRCLLLTTGLGMPLTAFLCVNADAVVGFAFGQRWLPSAPIFRALAPAAFLMTVTASMGWIYLSLGRARRQLPWSVFTTAVTIAAFILGLKWGVVGVALALSISRIALFLPTLIYTCSGSPVQWTDLLRTSARPACAALVSLAVSLAAGRMLGAGPGALAANTLVFAASYMVCWMLIPGGLALLRDSLTIPNALAQHRRAATPTVTKRRRVRLGVISSEFFDPRVGRMGGFGWAARSLAQVFNEDSSAGVEMVYLARELHATPGAEEERLHGSRVILRRASRFGNFRTIRRERFDLLLTIDYNRADTVYLRSAPRTPAIIWVRDPRTPDDVRKIQSLRIPGAETEEPQGLWCSDCSSVAAIERESRWLNRKLMFATPAPHLAGKLEAAYGIEPSEMYLLPNVIPVNPVRVAKSARPSVVFLGRLDPIKRPWIFAALAARHRDTDFLLLGKSHFTGPGSWRPQSLPSNLRLLGHVGEEDKFRVLSSAWVAVNTSIHEGLAVSLLEALACETPLVACQDPGSLVSRHGVYAGRYDGSGMDSLDAFSDALQTVFENPNLRRDLGGSGRAWVEATHSRRRFLECFDRLCERAGVRAGVRE
jgi:glycosyltransferase involved in cell wall biosynthesis